MSVRDDLPALAGALVLTLVGLVVALRLDVVPLDVPRDYAGDALVAIAAADSVIDGGWWYEQPRLGAPLGADRYDYPLVDPWHLVMFKLVGPLVGGNPVLTVNVLYLLGFLLITAAMYVAARQVGVGPAGSALAGVAYAFLPYHFWRGTSHLFLSAYFAVPLAMLVVLWQLGPQPAFLPDGVKWHWRDRRGVLAVVILAMTALTEIYYTLLVLLVLVVVAVARVIGDRDRRVLWSSALLVLAAAATLLLTLTPTVVYQVAHGRNEQVARRAYSDIETYALRPVLLVLPPNWHRIPALRAPATRVEAAGEASEGGQALGVLGTLGLVGLLGAGISRLAGRPRGPALCCAFEPCRLGCAFEPRRLAGQLALVAIVAILLGSRSGLGSLLGVAGFTYLRSLNRIVVVIAFAALIAVGLIADRALRRLSAAAALSVAMVVAALAIADQSQPVSLEIARHIDAAYASDVAFVAAVEDRLPRGARVYQLPFVEYPEVPPPGTMLHDESLRLFLHSEDLAWSFGAMKGRYPEWQGPLHAQGLNALLAGVAVLDFAGLTVDRSGFDDFGVELEAALRDVLGPATLTSRDQRFLFFDLQPLAADVRRQLGNRRDAVAAALLTPPQLSYDSAFGGFERDAGVGFRWMLGPRGVIRIVNGDDRARAVTLTGELRRGPGPDARMTLSVQGQRLDWVLGPDDMAELSVPVDVPPGETEVVLTVDGEAITAPTDPRTLFLRVDRLAVRDFAIDALASVRLTE